MLNLFARYARSARCVDARKKLKTRTRRIYRDGIPSHRLYNVHCIAPNENIDVDIHVDIDVDIRAFMRARPSVFARTFSLSLSLSLSVSLLKNCVREGRGGGGRKRGKKEKKERESSDGRELGQRCGRFA